MKINTEFLTQCNYIQWNCIQQMKIKSYLKNTNDVNGIMDKIKETSNHECDYEKDYMKIKFNSDDDLPLNKALKKMVNFIHKFFQMILCMN